MHRSWPKLKGYFCKPLERLFLAYFHMQDKPRYWCLLENGVIEIIILTVHENSSWEHLSAHCSAQKCWFKGPECGCYVLTWTQGVKNKLRSQSYFFNTHLSASFQNSSFKYRLYSTCAPNTRLFSQNYWISTVYVAVEQSSCYKEPGLCFVKLVV